MAVSRTANWISGGEPYELHTAPLNENETQEHLDQRHATALAFWQNEENFPPD